MTWQSATAEVRRLESVKREYGRLVRALKTGNGRIESRAVAALRRLGVDARKGL